MTRVLRKGSFHPGKVSWVSFPTPLPVLGRVGEHGKSPDLCLCPTISTHTHTQVRGWITASPEFPNLPLSHQPCPAVTPIPRDECWPGAAHTCLCWCLCLGSGAVGAKQGLLQTTRWEKPSGFGTAPCCRFLPSIHKSSSPPWIPLWALQRDVKGAGTWHRTPARADVTPNVQAELFLLLPPSPTATRGSQNKQPPGNELGYSQRRAARSAFPTGNTASCGQLCPADPPRLIPPSREGREGGEKRTEGGEKALLAQ